ncbi:hypothetical protein [Actinospica robiniae]|uniref:hypothetical protein n=1 Tax=Actinospica robiniae TaxID=304901 RepID=UPI0004138008|nr:hypothetical protein [Actinospica robiniae]
MTEAIKRLREPAALGAALFAALSELAAVIVLLFTGNGSFSDIAAGQASALLSFEVALALAIAVYLANHAGAPLGKARLVTLISLITAAAGGLFGLVAFFAGLGATGSGTDKFAYFLRGVAGLIVLGLAAWYTWLTWQSAHAPAPAQVGGFRGPQGGGGQGGPQQPQPGGPAPAGFNWSPGQANDQTAYLPPQNPAGPPTLQAQQSATGSYSVPGGQGGQGAPGGDQRTQMIPPVPPTMQEYAPSPQPWQPAGQNPPQPPPTRPMPPEGQGDPNQQQPPFGVGNWQ